MTVQIAQDILSYLNTHVVGKAEQNDVLVSSLIAGKNVFFVGAPGIGKSYSANLLSQCMANGSTKLTQFARDTREEEIFGPLDLTKLMPKDGSQTRYVRVAGEDGIVYAQDADIFIMDEPANAPSGLLKRLHALLEERKVHTGEKWVDANLKIAVGTSNEMLPEDCYALNDRFTVRYECKDLSAADQFRFLKGQVAGTLEKPTGEAAPKVTPEQLSALRDLCKVFPWSDAAMNVVSELIAALATRHLTVSTRNWENALPCIQAHAMLQGALEVKPHHVAFAKHILWRQLADRQVIWDVIDEIVPNPREAFEQALAQFDEKLGNLNVGSLNAGVLKTDPSYFKDVYRASYDLLKFGIKRYEDCIENDLGELAPDIARTFSAKIQSLYEAVRGVTPGSNRARLDILWSV